MKNLLNVELIHISTVDGKMMATISYQDPNNLQNNNNGYDHIQVPVNLRDIQLSAYDKVLVDQSVRPEPVAIASQPTSDIPDFIQDNINFRFGWTETMNQKAKQELHATIRKNMMLGAMLYKKHEMYAVKRGNDVSITMQDEEDQKRRSSAPVVVTATLDEWQKLFIECPRLAQHLTEVFPK